MKDNRKQEKGQVKGRRGGKGRKWWWGWRETRSG
jgi:hypothetical protein